MGKNAATILIDDGNEVDDTLFSKPIRNEPTYSKEGLNESMVGFEITQRTSKNQIDK